ncbi:ribonucleoside-triphosphate reductase, adenosylcobalamin-dependent [Micromonospora sp. WMMD961]|uniref:ribonucleoside-triphosphate reductase, adenosylcobalamin-dependent n=1 Tax=Micromonospora sp. WMMD961 TaxID=3016100 RepID=UPI0024177393|nr:ribonucleoside-triphosphate reductase, adenosylcobalamin-dependent [Micromonospora sp. WMMD961]MDG4783217.1 ribonucleoside-triphosphate reductase, adenosylcobalamin-dependent [Micromonospora sp. WMMD961]
MSFIELNPSAFTFGPTGEVVYDRTYSRTQPDGSKEAWPDTVERVAAGNMALVYGPKATWSAEVVDEYERLKRAMLRFAVIPAGRHLWATGVSGRQFLFNCHVAGWQGDKLSEHFRFAFLRLMEGGGVGANYSSRFLTKFGPPNRQLRVHIVCDPMHQDYADMKAAGLLSEEYDSDWAGAFEVEDSREGWADALVDLIDTYMTLDPVKHENRVYDVSRVRCKGSRLKTFGGTASGPAPFAQLLHRTSEVLNRADARAEELPFDGMMVTPLDAMEIDHAIAECVVSGGNRRSARMSIVHWRDPFIRDFIAAKRDSGLHWTTNLSIEIDDAFVQGLVNDDLEAVEIHRLATEAALTDGEPGYWNSDYSSIGEINQIVATNPCGEIPLPESGACVLGHVNLNAFAPIRRGGPVDWLGLDEAHRLMTRFLIRATHGDMLDAGQKQVMESERRIGVGHFGVQAFYAKRGYPYAVVPKIARLREELRDMKDEVRAAARQYAFELRIPEPVKVTTVAPTGTIAKLPGTTEGIHPIMHRFFIRRVRFSLADAAQRATVESFREQGFTVETCVYDASGNTAVVEFPTKESLLQEVEDLGYSKYEAIDLVQSSGELTLDEMLSFQAMYQTEYADNAVSFTANIKPGMDLDEAAATIARWLPKLKGTTIMPDNGSRPQAPYEAITEAEYEAAQATLIADGIDEECATGACPVR